MPILRTARAHFDKDISRAQNLLSHAGSHPKSTLRDDIARASWMMAVGAIDAYFCDAYADLFARTLQAKQRQKTFNISDRLLNLKVPASAVISDASSESWRWRMAARQLIEEESVLSIREVRDLFNKFCREAKKPFSKSNFDEWIVHPNATHRLFGISAASYRKLKNKAANGQGTAAGDLNKQRDASKKLDKQRDASIKHFESRYAAIFKRRHDCIHNCDRPKVALNVKNLTPQYVSKVIADIVFLVEMFEDFIKDEFPEWLSSLGAEPRTRVRVLQ